MIDKPKVIIIDDEKDLVENLKDIMEEDYSIEIAYDGRSGIDKCRDNTFDLAYVDIKLPDIPGNEVARRIVELSPKTDCVLITAYASIESAVDAVKQYGVVAYEIKPLDMDHVLTLSREIMRRKRLENSLSESENLYAALFQHNPIQTVVVDKEGRVIALNRAKMDSGDRLPNVGDVMYKDYARYHQNDMYKEMMECIKTDTMGEFPEQIYRSKVLSVRISPFEKGAIITSLDITERKRAEERIVHLNELLRAIRNINQLITHEKDPDFLIKNICDNLIQTRSHSNVWIALYDESNRFITASHSGLYDDFPEFVKRLEQGDIFPCIKNALDDSEIVTIDNPIDTCSDCPLYSTHESMGKMILRLEYNDRVYGVISVGVESLLFDDEEEKSLLKEVADDIAFAFYSMELEEERKRLQEQLVHSEKLSAVGQLAAGVAHEFNNLLTIILGHAQLSQEEDSIDDIKESLQEIEKIARRGGEVVNNLAAFARPKEPKFKIGDITGVIDEALRLQEKQHQLENIDIEKEYFNHSNISFDWGQLQQVFLNLLINASHAIRSNGSGKIFVSVKDVDNNVEIRLGDTGIGMDEETRMKIFDPFFSTKGAWAKDKFGISGTGLGLSVTHTIIDQHGGTIIVESKKGEGAVFTITFPIANKFEEENVPVTTIYDVDINEIKELRVMLVDDEEKIVNLMNSLFTRIGFNNIFVERSAKKALDLLHKFNPDIVFLDMIMPEMSGEEVFREIRVLNPQTKVVFMSGKLDFDKVKAAEIGAYDYIQKPYNIKDILNTMQRIAREEDRFGVTEK
ncbi:MAG: response regulator [Spirochaetota bacterium]|nr:response regulator [Spirochaetota bacterium]